MRVSIRRMLHTDIPRVMEIDRESFPKPWQESAYQAEISNPAGHYLVAEIAGKIAGYIGAWIVEDEAHITTIGVDPAYRRRHVGERLLSTALEEAQRRNVERVSLEVRESNLGAQRLYQKYGFTNVGRRKAYYVDNDEDALVMWIPDLGKSPVQELLRARREALVADVKG